MGMNACMYVCMFAYMDACVKCGDVVNRIRRQYLSKHACMYVCMYACMHVCMYAVPDAHAGNVFVIRVEVSLLYVSMYDCT